MPEAPIPLESFAAGQLLEQRAALARAWVERITHADGGDSDRTPPTDALLDALSEVLGKVADFLCTDDESALATDPRLVQTLRRLSHQRRQQGHDVQELIRALHQLAQLLDQALIQWVEHYPGTPPATSVIRVAGRLNRAPIVLSELGAEAFLGLSLVPRAAGADGGGKLTDVLIRDIHTAMKVTEAAATVLERDQMLQGLLEELQTVMDEWRMTTEDLVSSRLSTEGEKAYYQDLFEAAPCAYLISDPDAVIQDANSAAGELFGCDPARLRGRTVGELITRDSRRELTDRLRKLQTGDRSSWEFELHSGGFSGKTVSCAASRSRPNDGGAARIYWLIREVGSDETGTAQLEGGDPLSNVSLSQAAERPSFNELLPQTRASGEAPVPRRLYEIIAGALDSGALQPGQRLPSIRAIADHFDITPYAALQAYAALEAEGVVERRERSGVYVAPLDWPAPPRLPETAEWLARVLTEACAHHLRIPKLPELVRNWTASVPLRALCVESSLDSRASLAHELSYRFGIDGVTAEPDDLSPPLRIGHRTAPPEILADADLVVTTPFHASGLRSIAAAAQKPLLVATLNPDIVQAIDAHVADRPLTVICLERTFGDRLAALHGGVHRDLIRVVLAAEFDGRELDPTEPVFISEAARETLAGMPVRLIAPPSPCYSLEFAGKLTAMLLRANLDAGRT